MSTQYDVFVSYARKDNLPRADGQGLVSRVVDLLSADSLEPKPGEVVQSDPALKIFFDKTEIEDEADWRARILGGLSSSRLLVVFVSENYLASQPCRWEWDAFQAKVDEIHVELGFAGVFPVLLRDPARLSPDHDDDWLSQILGVHAGTDLQAWGRDQGRALGPDFDRQIASLRTRMVSRLRNLAKTPGNLRQPTLPYVGRTQLLKEMHRELLSPAPVGGRLTVLTGPPGVGKTELMTHYAYWNPDQYVGGAWFLKAKGHKNLISLLASLADSPAFEFEGTEPMRKDSDLMGEGVLRSLVRRSEATPDVLVLLDNVTEPELLSQDQIAQLPSGAHLRFVATTRLAGGDLPHHQGLHAVTLQGLTIDDGTHLIERLAGLDSPWEWETARRLVELVHGNPAAIRLVGRQLRSAKGHGLGLDQVLRQVEDRGVDETVAYALFRVLIESLEGEARVAMEAASLLPEDAILWSWVFAAIESSEARRVGEPERAGMRAELLERGLLNGDPDGAVVTMPVEQARWLRDMADQGRLGSLRAMIDKLLSARARALVDGVGVEPHEPEALADALLDRLVETPAFATRVNLEGLPAALSQHLGDDRPVRVATEVAAALPGPEDASPAEQAAAVIALNNLADQERFRDAENALKIYQNAHQRAERLRSLQPEDPVVQDLVADALTGVASVQRKSNSEAAESTMAKALALREELARSAGRYEDLRQLIAAYDLMSRIVIKRDPKWAMRLHHRSLEAAERLESQHPGDLLALRELAKAHISLSRDQEKTEPAIALGHARSAYQACNAILEQQPTNLEARNYLASALSAESRLTKEDDPAHALAAAEEAVRIADEVAAEQPGNLEAQRARIFPVSSLARFIEDEDPDRAWSLIRESLETSRELAQAQPKNQDAQRGYAIALTDAARLATALAARQAAQAQAFAEEALSIDKDQHDTQGHGTSIRGLGFAHKTLAAALELHQVSSLRNPEGALEHARLARLLLAQAKEALDRDQWLSELDEQVARLSGTDESST